MSIKFERYQLLELFDTENILDQEIGEYEYNIRIKGFCFNLHLIQCDEYASITLKADNLEAPIFDIGFDNVNRIVLGIERDQRSFISFLQHGREEPFLTVMVKPQVSLQYHID